VPRRLYFLVTLVISATVTYFAVPFLPSWLAVLSPQALPREVIQTLQNSQIVGFAAFVSLFSLVMYVLAFLPLVFHAWLNMSRARARLAQLPLACDKIHQTSKKAFLKCLEGLDFIYELAIIYSTYLVQLPAREVSPDILKKIKTNRLLAKKKNEEKVLVEPVRAKASAAVVFSPDILVDHRVFLWFFGPLPKALLGIGSVLLVVSLISVSVLSPVQYTELLERSGMIGLVQPGLIALGYCVFAAVLMGIVTTISIALLQQYARELSQMIDHLFHHEGWQEEVQIMAATTSSSTLAGDLEKALNRPMTALSKAARALAEDQKGRVDELLKETLVSFRKEMDKSSGKQIAALSSSLDKAQKTADIMQKTFAESSAEFSRQLATQAKALASQLKEMNKQVQESEKKAQESLLHKAETLIELLKEEMGENYRNYGEFIGGHIGRIETAQDNLLGALKDKDSIIQGLHKTSRDLSMISEASGKLVDKFGKLSRELDQLLKQAKTLPAAGHAGVGDNTELIKALENLKAQTDRKISALPDL